MKTYIHANGEILAQHDGSYTSSRYFYLHDRLGSVRQIIDTSGNVKNYYTYNSFGETLEYGGSIANSFMFTGQYYDAEISEYYLRARQYDPQLMRFSGRDPVDGAYEEPMTLHKYLYCLNDPINSTDPTGEMAIAAGEYIEAERTTFSMGVLGLATKVVEAATISYLGYEIMTHADDIFDPLFGLGVDVKDLAAAYATGAVDAWGRSRTQFPKEFGYNERYSIDRLIDEMYGRASGDIPPQYDPNESFWKKASRFFMNLLRLWGATKDKD